MIHFLCRAEQYTKRHCWNYKNLQRWSNPTIKTILRRSFHFKTLDRDFFVYQIPTIKNRTLAICKMSPEFVANLFAKFSIIFTISRRRGFRPFYIDLTECRFLSWELTRTFIAHTSEKKISSLQSHTCPFNFFCSSKLNLHCLRAVMCNI